MWQRVLWVWALCLVAGVSHAQGPQVSWDSHSGYGYANGPGKVTVTAAKYEAKSADFARLLMGRSYTPGGSAGHSIMRDLMSKPSNLFGGANPLPAALERQVTAKAVAKGVARMLPGIGTALLIADVIDLVESSGCKLNLNSAEIECLGEMVEEVKPSGVWKYSIEGTGKWAESVGGAVAIWKAQVAQAGNCATESMRCTPVSEGDAPFSEGSNVSSIQLAYIGKTVRVADWSSGSLVYVWVAAPPQRFTKSFYRSMDAKTISRCEFELNENGECVMNPTPDDFADRVPPDDEDNAAKRPNVMDWMDKNGGRYETGNPRIVDLPPSISGGRYETTNNPDGSTTTKDRDYLLRTSSSPSLAPTIIVDIRDTVTTWPSGVTPDPAPDPGTLDAPRVTPPSGGSQGTTTISNGGGSGETVVEVKSCGLPDTPPCKIDESGTPDWEPKDGSADAGGIFAALGACLADISSCVPALPDLSWSFSLPSSCAAIPMPGFEPFLSEVNICPYQPTIHDLMSMVWAAAGLFAGIAMVGRDARASI